MWCPYCQKNTQSIKHEHLNDAKQLIAEDVCGICNSTLVVHQKEKQSNVDKSILATGRKKKRKRRTS